MANTLVGKLGGEFPLNCSVDDFFHGCGGKAHQLPDLINHKINSVYVHEGDWKTDGSIKKWTYVIDGQVEVLTERIKIDEETKTVTLEALDGDLMKHYKKYIAKFQGISRDGSNFAVYSIEYEKRNENGPIPIRYLEWLHQTLTALDASLAKP